jgi:hypothetical protein
MAKIITTVILSLTIVFVGCEKKKIEPLPVGEMNEYKDPAYGFKIKYPKEWKQLGQVGKATFAKSQEVLNKFIDPKSGEEGAMASVEVIKLEGKTHDEIIEQQKSDYRNAGYQFSADEQITLNNKPAVKLPYFIQVTTKTKISGYMVYVKGDTALYALDFVAYGDHYTINSNILNAMLQSFELPVIVPKESNVWQPSASLETYTSEFFTMQYPDNLNIVPQTKGKNDFVMEMRADRLDCSIHIDVFGAQKLTIDKVWEQNKGKYRAKATGETTIDGEKAFWVDYSLRKDINSRAYFVVKNDKVIRITLNWYAPQQNIYFTTFENCVKSLKLK